MSNVKISELNLLQVSSISMDDFLPLVDSGSLTTYRISLDKFNTWLNASGSAISASYARTASFVESASYANSSSATITASYALLANDANWATFAYDSDEAVSSSYSYTASMLLGTIDSASYAKTSSIAVSSLYSLSASYSVTASYSYSGSYALISSNSITSSNAITASFALSTSPTALVFPPLISGLRIIPSWETYGSSTYGDIPFQQIQVKIDSVVVNNVSNTNSLLLQYKYLLVDRNLSVGTAIANTGSLDTGTFTNNAWYNIWIIYNSTIDQTSCMICESPGGITTTAPVMPAGYDYRVRIGSIKDSSGIFWREWHEYGTVRKWFYRTSMPTGYGMNGGGLSLTHYLGDIPRNTNVRLKLKKISGPSSVTGYSLGDELRSEDFIADVGEMDIPMFGSIATKTKFNLWVSQASTGIRSSRITDGANISWGTGPTSAPYFDLLISAEI